jgi:hypothetical protein
MIDVLLAGLGNIGLPMAENMARMNDVRSILLCDPDEYFMDNSSGQLISRNAHCRRCPADYFAIAS